VSIASSASRNSPTAGGATERECFAPGQFLKSFTFDPSVNGLADKEVQSATFSDQC
jgi:hypothetical protein